MKSIPSGFAAVDGLSWGSHLCHLYVDAADLTDAVVPFVHAGIKNGERCVVVAADPVPPEAMREALCASGSLREAEKSGQLRVVGPGAAPGQAEGAVGEEWLAEEASALESDYTGLRWTGNAGSVAAGDLKALLELERRLASACAGRRIVALCSYAIAGAEVERTFEIASRHGMTLMRRGGELVCCSVRSLADERAAQQRRQVFIGALGHEIRNPLNMAALASDMLRMSPDLDESEQRALGTIRDSVTQMQAILADLLDFARLSEGEGLELSIEPTVDALDACRVAVEQLGRVHPTRRVELQVARNEAGCWDRHRVTQLLTILIGNALVHGEDPVTVSLEVEEDHQVIAVTNAGKPLSPELLPKLFEPFRRASRARGGAGLGLGLPLAREIAWAHDGAIDAESTPGGWTTFTARLPLRGPRAARRSSRSIGGGAHEAFG